MESGSANQLQRIFANQRFVAVRYSRSSGMEQYVVESNRPLIRCLGDVAIVDVYVLILAWRYGHVPSEDNPDRHSITELEFRQAIANQKSVLAFLLDPDCPWPPNAMDSASRL